MGEPSVCGSQLWAGLYSLSKGSCCCGFFALGAGADQIKVPLAFPLGTVIMFWSLYLPTLVLHEDQLHLLWHGLMRNATHNTNLQGKFNLLKSYSSSQYLLP